MEISSRELGFRTRAVKLEGEAESGWLGQGKLNMKKRRT